MGLSIGYMLAPCEFLAVVRLDFQSSDARVSLELWVLCVALIALAPSKVGGC